MKGHREHCSGGPLYLKVITFCIWATERRQRIGDLVAKTVVVHV